MAMGFCAAAHAMEAALFVHRYGILITDASRRCSSIAAIVAVEGLWFAVDVAAMDAWLWTAILRLKVAEGCCAIIAEFVLTTHRRRIRGTIMAITAISWTRTSVSTVDIAMVCIRKSNNN